MSYDNINKNIDNLFRLGKIYDIIKDRLDPNNLISIVINTKCLNCFLYSKYFEISDDIKKFLNLLFHFEHLIFRTRTRYPDMINILVKLKNSYIFFEYRFEFTLNKFNGVFDDVYIISILEFDTLQECLYNLNSYVIKEILYISENSSVIYEYPKYKLIDLSEFYNLYIK